MIIAYKLTHLHISFGSNHNNQVSDQSWIFVHNNQVSDHSQIFNHKNQVSDYSWIFDHNNQISDHSQIFVHNNQMSDHSQIFNHNHQISDHKSQKIMLVHLNYPNHQLQVYPSYFSSFLKTMPFQQDPYQASTYQKQHFFLLPLHQGL